MNARHPSPLLALCLAVATFAAAVAVTACGGDDSGGSTATSATTPSAAATSGAKGSTAVAASPSAQSKSDLDACTLVTQDEASAAIAEPVRLDAHTATAGRAECTYVSSNNVGSEVVFVMAGSTRAEKDAYDLAKKTYSNAKPASGIGEDAFTVELGAPVAQVHVYKNGHYLLVAITNMNDPQRLEKAIALARKAASRL